MALTRLSAAQARVICLHYYSNALTFNFSEDPNEVTHLNSNIDGSKTFFGFASRKSIAKIR